MKLFPIQAGDRPWWMKWLLCTLMALGILLFYPSDCFCPLASLHGCYVFLASYQLDIKNAFLHGDLAEEVYMEQPPSFVAQGESGLVCRLRRSLYGLKQSPRAWFSHFSSVVQEFGMLRSTADHSVFIIITPWGSTKDLGKLKYFLGIEIAQSSSGVVLSQRKTGGAFRRPGRYRRLVGKLNYLTITRPDIFFSLTPGQGVLYENRGHTQVVGYTDADWAGSPTDRRSTSGYCVFIGGPLHIASNPVFHERTKHIEVDCHFIREKIASGCVATSFVNSNDQLADIFTKSLRGPRIKYICNKLGAYDVYAPA
ncbi:Retrovirus-related Pol polyprotein from transposon RE1 [Vitis vinifera]|uniref:Retrovirus-related Pol polyprotein from transposon RE1 n=1 Tax=Vitis vinifera TaxID=29760 RepID=A0A438JN17_VITVI|nr:Retrovirus-related Pol polyprotein from transposon RE1 [Vitis vinifera]